MSSSIMKKFLAIQYQYQYQYYSHGLLVAKIAYHTAPVRMGIKPAVLLNMGKPGKPLHALWINNHDQIVQTQMVKYYSFIEGGGSTQVLFYNPRYVQNLLLDKGKMAFLESYGYRYCFDLTVLFQQLQHRFNQGCPHEMGIILGYPLCDVSSFIANSGRHFLFNGYWKVYHQPERAQRIFRAYDYAKSRMLLLLQKGASCKEFL